MIDEKRKIKDIYNSDYTLPEGEVYPLQRWYAQLINKNFNELEVLDVVRMLRQNEFVDLAIAKAVRYLEKDPFVGDMYEGEILEKISKLNTNDLMPYIDELKIILKKALEESQHHEWLLEEDKDEFGDLIKSLISKLS